MWKPRYKLCQNKEGVKPLMRKSIEQKPFYHFLCWEWNHHKGKRSVTYMYITNRKLLEICLLTLSLHYLKKISRCFIYPFKVWTGISKPFLCVSSWLLNRRITDGTVEMTESAVLNHISEYHELLSIYIKDAFLLQVTSSKSFYLILCLKITLFHFKRK